MDFSLRVIDRFTFCCCVIDALLFFWSESHALLHNFALRERRGDELGRVLLLPLFASSSLFLPRLCVLKRRKQRLLDDGTESEVDER